VLTEQNVTIVDPVATPFEVEGGTEVTSSRSGAGFAFKDRTQGSRWVWYAENGTARLYIEGGGDRMSIDKDATIHAAAFQGGS
jgi:hypothetical protein